MELIDWLADHPAIVVVAAEDLAGTGDTLHVPRGILVLVMTQAGIEAFWSIRHLAGVIQYAAGRAPDNALELD